uniref:Protein Wnt n=1 Tax=Macaca fascicularis TaxID=9541 RepID=A0A7N9D9M5_MACFA
KIWPLNWGQVAAVCISNSILSVCWSQRFPVPLLGPGSAESNSLASRRAPQKRVTSDRSSSLRPKARGKRVWVRCPFTPRSLEGPRTGLGCGGRGDVCPRVWELAGGGEESIPEDAASAYAPQSVPRARALNPATRESAFVHAIASAGVAFAVTRSCAEGTSTICGCDSHHKGPPGEGWKWGGCSEDADFGVLVSREFADARENRPDARSAMNKHNNEAGRTTILDHMHLKCKCHGLSGSCEVKTCWWAQPDFRAIGDFLKDKYDSASEMVVEKHRESRGWVETLRAKYSLFKPPTERDLVYYENSPNFCEPNPETGSFGTRDRTCNVTSHGIDGCDLLCCGRGHNTRTEKRKEKCHCIFHWCCYVSCQECIRIYDVHTCK